MGNYKFNKDTQSWVSDNFTIPHDSLKVSDMFFDMTIEDIFNILQTISFENSEFKTYNNQIYGFRYAKHIYFVPVLNSEGFSYPFEVMVIAPDGFTECWFPCRYVGNDRYDVLAPEILFPNDIRLWSQIGGKKAYFYMPYNETRTTWSRFLKNT
jgi:hypothetical protein